MSDPEQPESGTLPAVSADEPERAPAGRVLRAMLRLAWRASGGHLVLGIALSLTSGVLPMLSALVLAGLLDDLRASSLNASDVTSRAVLLSCLTGATLAAGYVATYASGRLQLALTRQSAEELYERVSSLQSLRVFEDAAFHDRLALAQAAAQGGPQDVVAFALAAIQRSASVIAFGSALFLLWPPMGALLLAASLPAVAAHLSLARHASAAAEDAVPARRRALYFQSIALRPDTVPAMLALGLGSWFHQRMSAALRHEEAIQRALMRRVTAVELVFSALNIAVAAIATVVVARGTFTGAVTLGQLTLFLAAIAVGQSAVAIVVGQFGQANAATRMFRYYLAVVDHSPDLPSDDTDAPPLQDAIEVKDVWFRYDDSLPWALKGVTLRLAAGTTTGLVGLNGAGKSTLVKLLLRMYEPTRGYILWDGVDLRTYTVTSIRERMGVVLQESPRFDLSAAHNVGLGAVRHVDDVDRIRTAARAASVGSELEQLPQGFATMLSTQFADGTGHRVGVNLSGGQWQRIGLARVLMNEDPDLLVLARVFHVIFVDTGRRCTEVPVL